MRPASFIAALMLLVLISCDGDNATSPSPTLVGTWDLVGFSDHGVPGETTGSCVFLEDGTFSVAGTVTYPGEPADPIDVTGTYQVVGATVRLTTGEGTGVWFLRHTGDQCVLSLEGSDPPTTMTLKRQR